MPQNHKNTKVHKICFIHLVEFRVFVFYAEGIPSGVATNAHGSSYFFIKEA